ncbi:FecR family protein [Parabacteroides timonensis]|uniref:FecR family protein n=1 Tax=Parabacteroides timonensis TaxID=1871013 RepID=UPI00094EF7E5|nr:FecR family protein [Parabacteroides timonensis]
MSNIKNRKDEEIKRRIQFKPVETEPDVVYNKMWQRIMNSDTIIMGVSSVWKYASIAVSIALLVVSSFLYKIHTEPRPLAYMEVASMVGSKTRVLLPDSTIVWLNGNSYIRYPEVFDENTRQIELIGEAFFDVTENKEKPFIVNLEGMHVQVLGTEFNILADANSGVIETTLIEGSVALFNEQNSSPTADRILVPGQQALFDKQSGSIEVRPVRTSSYTSWMTGDFFFEKITFGEILSVLERSFSVKFHLKNEAIKEVFLTAQFTHKESLEEILSILQISMRYKFEIKDRDVYIR